MCVFPLKNARQRRHYGGNLPWPQKGVTVSIGCQRLVTAGWLESMKKTLSGDEKEDVRGRVCVCECVKALTHFSLLHQPVSILQTEGLHPQGDCRIIRLDEPCQVEIQICA